MESGYPILIEFQLDECFGFVFQIDMSKILLKSYTFVTEGNTIANDVTWPSAHWPLAVLDFVQDLSSARHNQNKFFFCSRSYERLAIGRFRRHLYIAYR